MNLDNEIQGLANDLAELARSVGWTGLREAIPTRGDAAYTLLVQNGLPREIWLQDVMTGTTITAYYPSDSQLINFVDGDQDNAFLVVRVGYPPNSTQLTVFDANTLAGRQSVGTLAPREAYLNQAYWASLDQITPLRARTTLPTPSTVVCVDGPMVFYIPGTNTPYKLGTLTKDLASYITALSGTGKEQLVKLYYDRTVNVLGVQALTAQTPTGTLPSRTDYTVADLAGFTRNTLWIDIIPIYLYDSQTSIVEADFYRDLDMRPLWTGGTLNDADFDRIVTSRATGEVVVSRATGNVVIRRP